MLSVSVRLDKAEDVIEDISRKGGSLIGHLPAEPFKFLSETESAFGSPETILAATLKWCALSESALVR